MRRILLLINVLLMTSAAAMAQSQLAEQQSGALFAYPLAPDTCSTLESRCNYIITHFWEPFDFGKPITDEVAFERTFRDYVDFFRYAYRNVVLSAVRDFVNKSQANSGNLKKVGEMAERALYGADAEYWSDEVYVAFIKPLAAAKALPRDIRDRYARQLASINAVQTGMPLDFEYVGLDGLKHRLSDLTDVQTFILLFVDDSSDSMIGRLRMSTDVALNALLESGEATLVCLSVDKYSTEWATAASSWADNWTIGCGESLSQTLDLRTYPCCYVLDGERKVLNKTLSVESLLSAVNPNY